MDAHVEQVALGVGDHQLDRTRPEQVDPLGLGPADPAVAFGLGDGAADILQILAGILAFREIADVLAQRLSVAQVGRTRQDVDLGARIVDVVLSGDVESGLLQQGRQGVAEHRAAGMSGVQRTGRVGRDVLDVDPPTGAGGRIAVARAGDEDVDKLLQPDRLRDPQVDEARACNLGRLDLGQCRQRLGQRAGNGPRIAADRLGQQHGGVGGDVAVARIARWFDRHPVEWQAVGPAFAPREFLQRDLNLLSELIEYIHRSAAIIPWRTDPVARLAAGAAPSRPRGGRFGPPSAAVGRRRARGPYPLAPVTATRKRVECTPPEPYMR